MKGLIRGQTKIQRLSYRYSAELQPFRVIFVSLSPRQASISRKFVPFDVFTVFLVEICADYAQ